MTSTARKDWAPEEISNHYYDRSGQALPDANDSLQGLHQPLRSNYLLASEIGEEEITVTCGSILSAYLGTDTATGRASLRKMRLTDPDPVWADFGATWGHDAVKRLKSVYDGVTGATGAAPRL